MLADYEQRTLDLANRLHGMTYTEWGRVQYFICLKFERMKKESENNLQLSLLEEKDLRGNLV